MTSNSNYPWTWVPEPRYGTRTDRQHEEPAGWGLTADDDNKSVSGRTSEAGTDANDEYGPGRGYGETPRQPGESDSNSEKTYLDLTGGIETPTAESEGGQPESAGQSQIQPFGHDTTAALEKDCESRRL